MTTAKAAATRCFFISASVISASCALTLVSCGRYADFVLPVIENKQHNWLRLETNANPVLPRGSAGDVLNPSVIRVGPEFLNFYSEFDGHTWHTALARSEIGFVWKLEGKILSPDPATWESNYIAANGSALLYNGEYLYWYQAGERGRPQIGLADSKDLKTWRKRAQPVLSYGPKGSCDERGVADPYVIRIGDWFYLYYLGQNRAREQTICLARSRDGVAWEKLRSNPVLPMSSPGSGAMDENGLGEPAVWEWRGSYWMLFTGRDAQENRALGLARSADGVHWERSRDVFRGDQPWNNKVLCDPTVVVEVAKTRVWFGGGDVASPDENLHGQIGAGEMLGK